MTKFQRDHNGSISCRNRTSGFIYKDWCNRSLDFCCHGEDCRVPIPVKDPIGDIIRGVLDLLRINKDVLEKMKNLGPKVYCEQLNRINAAIAKGEQLLEEGE